MPPDRARVTRLMQDAIAAYRIGEAEVAIERCRDALKVSPDEPGALRLLSLALISNGQFEQAREAAQRGLKIKPGDPELLQALSTSYARRGRFDDARDAIRRALASKPDEPSLVATLADLHFRAGDYSEAAAALAPLVAGGRPHIGIAMAFATVAPRLNREREAIALLEASIGLPNQTMPQTVSALFCLGDLHDRLGDYDRAFHAYDRANRVKGPRPGADEYLASMDRMIAAWTPERVKTLPRAPERDPAPVFIVGMPRSGTSLTEQIIATHPAMFGAGEREAVNRLVRELQQPFSDSRFHLGNPEALTARSIERIGRTALRDLKALAPTAARITDKNPVNYLHLGLISLILPGARVLHCVRDPLDTCLSSYFHNLAGPDVMAGDLPLMGHWYNAYRRVMDHWKRVLDLPILDVVYEEMVTDQEGVSRRIVEFLGLDWREEMLRFHETRRPTLTPSVDQVRRPMYTTSVQRWRNYERHIGPLRASLASNPPASAAPVPGP